MYTVDQSRITRKILFNLNFRSFRCGVDLRSFGMVVRIIPYRSSIWVYFNLKDKTMTRHSFIKKLRHTLIDIVVTIIPCCSCAGINLNLRNLIPRILLGPLDIVVRIIPCYSCTGINLNLRNFILSILLGPLDIVVGIVLCCSWNLIHFNLKDQLMSRHSLVPIFCLMIRYTIGQ